MPWGGYTFFELLSGQLSKATGLALFNRNASIFYCGGAAYFDEVAITPSDTWLSVSKWTLPAPPYLRENDLIGIAVFLQGGDLTNQHLLRLTIDDGLGNVKTGVGQGFNHGTSFSIASVTESILPAHVGANLSVTLEAFEDSAAADPLVLHTRGLIRNFFFVRAPGQ